LDGQHKSHPTPSSFAFVVPGKPEVTQKKSLGKLKTERFQHNSGK